MNYKAKTRSAAAGGAVALAGGSGGTTLSVSQPVAATLLPTAAGGQLHPVNLTQVPSTAPLEPWSQRGPRVGGLTRRR